MTEITVYGIPNCDTVKRARAWLAGQGVVHQFHDFKKSGVPPPQWQAWVAALGWEPLLNRQGTTWRKLALALQAGVVDAASAGALVQLQPSVIKRPVVTWPDARVTVGFDAARWAERLAGR